MVRKKFLRYAKKTNYPCCSPLAVCPLSRYLLFLFVSLTMPLLIITADLGPNEDLITLFSGDIDHLPHLTITFCGPSMDVTRMTAETIYIHPNSDAVVK